MSKARPSFRERGYTARWDRLRKLYLSQHPQCVMCERDGRITAATVVDHIKPHRGDQVLMWDQDNWQSLCASHHNSTKQRAERRGYQVGCDAAGRPLDANHPWRKGFPNGKTEVEKTEDEAGSGVDEFPNGKTEG